MQDTSRDSATSAGDAPDDAPHRDTSGADTPAPRAPGTAPPDDAVKRPATVSIDTFARIELRVAEIVEAARVEGADKLLRLEVDLGGERRQLVAGIAKRYEPDVLIGRRIIVVANLEPARIRGVESQGMLLAAVDADGQPVLATFDTSVPAGSRVR